jgi:His-Xaa-Ser system radical SAM maturase HxsB
MILDTAKKVVETIFQSPSPIIKIEFQGGEPLLNWDIVKFITEYASLLNIKAKRKIEFVICTNLTLLEEYMIDFIKKYNICISTSLDGTKNLHDSCRINRMGHSGYDLFKQKLQLVKEKIGVNGCSALLTVTKSNINHLQEVINEYISCGFNGIFLRALNPYGFAKREWAKMGYPIEDFIKIYKETLKFIINLNLEGKRFIEFYASILLSRILTPFSTGFMDLQSPAGAAISGVIYDYNGDVYPTDESRMLARSGDRKFLMGNVLKSSYSRIFNGNKIREIIRSSNVEVLPQCASCVFQLYCGVDPIRNYAETKDIIGHRPTSEFCKKNTGIIQFLFDLIRENNPDVMDVFWSWVTHRSLEEIRG